MKNAQEYIENKIITNTNRENLAETDSELTGPLDLNNKQGLKRISLLYNGINYLNVENLDKLRLLMIGNGLTRLDLPLNSNSLVHLNLAKNPGFLLDELKKAIDRLPELKYLELSQNPQLKGSLEIFANLKKLIHLDIKGTEFSFGLEYLPSSLEHLYPSDILKEELDHYAGKSNEEKLEMWKNDEIVKGILKRIEELKQPQHLSIIENINPDWQELIWFLRRMVNRYSKEELQNYPIRLYPARTAQDSPFGLNASTPAFTRWHGNVLQEGWEYHFGLNYLRVKVVDTIAHEIFHLWVMLKEQTRELCLSQGHSPTFWKGYLDGIDGKVSSLDYLKNNLSLEDQKELEDLHNPLSAKFDSDTSWVYCPQHNIVKPGAVTWRKAFSIQEEINIKNEWDYIRRELFELFDNSMNEGAEEERKERWSKPDEEQYPRGISIRIKMRGEDGSKNSEIGIIYNPNIMPISLKDQVEKKLLEWCNQPAKSTNIEKAKLIEESSHHSLDANIGEQIAQVVQVNYPPKNS